MKVKYLPLFIFYFNCLATTDYVIESYRLPTTNDPAWLPGVRGGIPIYPQGIILTNAPYSLDPTGVIPIDTGLSNAIVAETNGKAMLLPAGDYKLTNYTKIPHTKQIVIRGPDYTGTNPLAWIHTTWTNSGSPYAAFLFNDDNATRVSPDVTSGYTRGSTSVVVSSVSGISLGNLIVLRHKTNDPAFYKGYSEAPGNSQFLTNYQSQSFKVTSISGTTIGFDRPIYWSNYNASFGPYLSVLQNNISLCGIENIGIGFPSNGNNDAGVKFSYADNCWMKNCVVTNNANQDVELFFAYDCEIRDNIIKYHSAYSSSSKYSVVLGAGTSDCLVENNIAQGNNLGIVCLLGACGNVIGYNFGFQGFGAGYPTDNAMKGGMNSHGDLAQFNLWEGNVFPWWQMDDFWGANMFE